MPARFLSAAAALVALAGSAHAGMTVQLVSAGRKVTVQLEGNKLRVEEAGQPLVVVFDGDAGRYLEIDETARTWAVATREDVLAAGKAADARVRERLATMDPEELKAWIERRNRARKRLEAAKQTRFEPTGNQSMIADQMCDGFDEVVGGEAVAWGCYAVWSRKTFRKEEFAGFSRLAEFLNQGLGQVEAAQGVDLRDGPLGRLSRSPGLPLFRLELADGGKTAVPFKISEITRQQLPPDRFQAPAGYTALDRPPSLVRPVKAALPADPAK